MLYGFHRIHGLILMPNNPRFRCVQIHNPSSSNCTATFHIPHSSSFQLHHPSSANYIATFHIPHSHISLI